MSLVGKKAPEFKAPAVLDGSKIINDFSIVNYIGKKEILLFFYPKDFTFVCPTELISFQEYLEEFKARNVQVIGCSTDTEECHLAWLNTPVENGGIQGINYPLVADCTKAISHNYGVLAGEWDYNESNQLEFAGSPIAYRGTFLIDKEGIVRYESINDFPIGRNIEEIIRIVDTLQHTEKYGEVCPANWTKGQKALTPTREGIVEYIEHYIDTSYSYKNLVSQKKGGCCGGNCGCSNENCDCEKETTLMNAPEGFGHCC